MPGRIIYLEVDDEITSAAARIRAADARRIAVVLPYGSRIATSRINFRLLSRDALEHEKRLSMVSGDPATRALAASAGLPVFASVAEYESSLPRMEEEPRPGTDVPVVPVSAAQPPADAAEMSGLDPEREPDGTLGLVLPASAAAAAAIALPGDTVRTTLPHEVDHRGRPSFVPPPPTPGAPARATTGPFGRGAIRMPWVIGGAILALALLIAGVGAYLLLPSATIAVTPRPERVGPLPVKVVADPNATQPDAVAGVVPAKTVSVPVSVNDTFPATGTRVALTKATGSVRFDNLDPTSTNRVAAGSVVRTESGVRFRTAVTVTVPAGNLVPDFPTGFKIIPGRVTVNIAAIDGGPDGNVDANKIVVVPSSENSIFLKVTNPDATHGGTRHEFKRITQADVDSAIAALNTSLTAAFNDAMGDPSLTAGGATVFPETGVLGTPTPTVVPDTLIGQEVAAFPLGMSATGTVVTVDPAPVSGIAEAQLRAAVKPDYKLVPGSISITPGDALVIGQNVTFPVIATAQQVAILDPAGLKAKVLGKPVEEAKAILAPYGQVDLNVWPDWAGSVPSFESRVDLTVEYAAEIQAPTPSSSASP
jgi:hypothetical protein